MSFTNPAINQLTDVLIANVLPRLTPAEQIRAARACKAFKEAVDASLKILLASVKPHPTISHLIIDQPNPSAQLQKLFSIIYSSTYPEGGFLAARDQRNEAFFHLPSNEAVRVHLLFNFQRIMPIKLFYYGCYANDLKAATFVPFEIQHETDLEKGLHLAILRKYLRIIGRIIPHCSSTILDKALAIAITMICINHDERLEEIIRALLNTPKLTKLNRCLVQATQARRVDLINQLFDSKKPIAKEVSDYAGLNHPQNREVGLQKALCTAIRQADLSILEILVRRGYPNKEMLNKVHSYAEDLASSINQGADLGRFIIADIDLEATNRGEISEFLRNKARELDSFLRKHKGPTHFSLM